MIARLRGPHGLKADKPSRPSGFLLSPLAQRSAAGETCSKGSLAPTLSAADIAARRSPID